MTDDGHTMATTRPGSSESHTESPESMGSTDRGVDGSPNCSSNVPSPSKTGYSKRDIMMMPPEEKLKHFDSQAQIHEDNQEAHTIAMSHSPDKLEGAQISHSLALVLSAAAETHHNDSAGHYFEQSLSAYKNCVGPQDPAFLTAQDDYCRFLLLNGQQERCVEIQRASLVLKKSTFGDLSAEVADTLQLIGSVEMTEGRMLQAHRTMTK
ncbi:hypothetical protein INR49_007823, partial [Caranx melampygus]